MSGISNLPCGGSKLETDDFIIYSLISSGDRSGTVPNFELEINQNISRIIFSTGGMLIKMYYNLPSSRSTNAGSQIYLYDNENNIINQYYKIGTTTLGTQENTQKGFSVNETYEVNKYVKRISAQVSASSTGTGQYTNASYVSIVLIKQK